MFVDAENPRRRVETFMLESWLDHLRQHERVTEADRQVQAQVHAFHRGAAPPKVTHLMPATSRRCYAATECVGTRSISSLPSRRRTGARRWSTCSINSVEGGASVNFVQPMTRAKAEAWSAGALASHARGERLIFAATIADRLDGTVQLIPATQENQAFRADIAKMLVHRRVRNLGVGTALLTAAEDEARRIGRTLLTLDTQTGGAGERLYARLGWTKFGEVPGYATSANGRCAGSCELLLQESLSQPDRAKPRAATSAGPAPPLGLHWPGLRWRAR